MAYFARYSVPNKLSFLAFQSKFTAVSFVIITSRHEFVSACCKMNQFLARYTMKGQNNTPSLFSQRQRAVIVSSYSKYFYSHAENVGYLIKDSQTETVVVCVETTWKKIS